MDGANVPLGESVSQHGDGLPGFKVFTEPVADDEHVHGGPSVPLTAVLDLQTLADGGRGGSRLQDVLRDIEGLWELHVRVLVVLLAPAVEDVEGGGFLFDNTMESLVSDDIVLGLLLPWKTIWLGI